VATDEPPEPRALLALLILVWAISWPVVKIGVASVPPVWYACLRYAIAAGCLFAVLAVRGGLAWPPRQDLRLIAVSALMQMAAYSALTGAALTELPPGRASILAFSTPIWVTPLAAWWGRERLSRPAIAGVAFGALGVLAIAGPSLRSGGVAHLSAYGFLMAAAAAWAVTIVFVRLHRFVASPLALAPWQMVLATVLLLPAALAIEGAPHAPGLRGAASLAFVGPIATAFGYWAVVEAGRRVPAGAMAMVLLAAPVAGILISAAALNETIDAPLLIGTALIGSGIRLATRPDMRATASGRGS
jgi:drug/metabolite transporter (DMT)-like permease